MTTSEITKRRRAEKIAYAINSIEGVPVSEETRRMSSQWDNGEITLEQIKAELIKKYKALSLIRHRNFWHEEHLLCAIFLLQNNQ